MPQESVAKILLINDEGLVLMLRLGVHKMQPKKSFMADLPGGIVDPGESELQAVMRETKEETGIVINSSNVTLGYGNTTFYARENKSVTRLLYVAKQDFPHEVTLSWEHEAYEWCSIDVLLGERGLSGIYKEAVSYLKSNQLI